MAGLIFPLLAVSRDLVSMSSRLIAITGCCAALLAGCEGCEPSGTCEVPYEPSKCSSSPPYNPAGIRGVDLLLVVDNTSSMGEEQGMLAGSLVQMVGTLVDPQPGWPYPPVDDLRVAVVSSDMGLMWGGNPYESGDGWPGDPPAGCGSAGDNGEFQTYPPGSTVDLEEETVECPDLDGAWAETPLETAEGDEPNPDLALQAACLSSLGTGGCSFEQPLQSAVTALGKESQVAFLRDGSLLAVLVVSDDDDCSIESNALFSAPELQGDVEERIELVCGNHPEHLYDAADIKEALLGPKDGKPGTVVFAAVAGVPTHDACQGPGHEIGDCLDHVDMQLDVMQVNDVYFFRPACQRWEGDEQLTAARPARRLVELAQELANMGYVHSICNADWTPAIDDLAALIAGNLASSCYYEALDWDPASRHSTCEVLVAYQDLDQCPTELGSVEPAMIRTWFDEDGEEHVSLDCALPHLPAELSCADNDFEASPFADGLGWYYCENVEGLEHESSAYLCDDGHDNDGDGASDCADPDCAPCVGCGGDGVECDYQTCTYFVQLTEAAYELVAGHGTRLWCEPGPWPHVDPDCRENFEDACNDGVDNDGDGVFDCRTIGGTLGHEADPRCCPMHVGEGGACVIETHEFCPGSSDEDPADACRAVAARLGCQLP